MVRTEDAVAALTAPGTDVSDERYGLEAVPDGMSVELEHGTRSHDPDVGGEDRVATVKTALAHLRELPGPLRAIEVTEREGEAAWWGKPGADVEVDRPETVEVWARLVVASRRLR